MKSNLLMSKLIFPKVQDLVPRQRLADLMAEAGLKKLALVTAGPGYGKTALAAQALANTPFPAVWYRLDPSDADPSVFFAYLLRGIRQYLPEFWQDGAHNGLPTADAFMAVLEAALGDAGKESIFLVLDDFHCLARATVIQSFIQGLLDRFFPQFHLVILSRSVPALKFSKLMADREVTWIREPDLAFTPGETIAFFKTAFHEELRDRDLDALMQKTRGWIAGMILFHQSAGAASGSMTPIPLEAGPMAPDPFDRFKGSHRLVYDYLEENVFQCMSPEDQDFAMKTSILSLLYTDFCNRLLGRTDSRAVLCRLEDSHFFTASQDPDRNSFSFHPLFREFLAEKLAMAMPGDRAAALYNDAARLYEQEDQDQEALRHHILAGNMGDASRLLNHLARPIIKQGRPQMVRSLLSSVPKHYMDDEPWFQYLQTGYLRLCNRLEMAVQNYERVLNSFRRQKDEQGECICRMELAEYYFSTGRLKKSETEYKKILQKEKLTTYLTIVVMGYLIRVLTVSGKTKESDKYARAAQGLLDDLKEPLPYKMAKAWIAMSRGYCFLLTGDYHKAMELGETSKSLFQSVGQQQFMFCGYFLISCSCYYLGRFKRGMAAAREGIRIETEKGGFDEFSEFLRLFHAKNLLETVRPGDPCVRDALAACRKSLDVFDAHDFPGGVAQACLVLHQAHVKAGRPEKAETVLHKALNLPALSGMPLVENELKTALSQLLLFEMGQERNQEAMALLKEAEQALIYSGWHMCRISMIFARYYWEAGRGHRETCFKYIVYSLKIAEEEGYDNWMVMEKQWIVPLLAELVALNSLPGYITGLCLKMGEAAESQLRQIKAKKRSQAGKAAARILESLPRAPAPGIRASFFGRFRLSVGDKMVPEKRWKSKKARTLFKYMLCHRQRGYLDKEILMELLWPEGDPKRSAQRFHVALAALRKTLEPAIAKGVKSSYIKRSGSAYCIDMGEDGSVDLALFTDTVASAQKAESPDEAAKLYRQAESLYKGDFLEEDPFEQWCVQERENYRNTYLSVLKALMAYHGERREYQDCIRFAGRYLSRDKYEETVIRDLMTWYGHIGNKPMVRRIYENFRDTIRKELNCGLSDETEILYAELV